MAIPDCGPECQETLREVERFLDGELDDVVRIRIEHHLSDCNPCMKRTEFRRYVRVVVASKCGSEEPPDGLKDRILELLRQQEPRETG